MSEHCRRCMVPRAGNCFGKPPSDCIRGEPVAPDQTMCHSMRADIAEAALMRAVCPEAFEGNRIKPGMLRQAMDAKHHAMRAACSVRGPTLVFERPSPHTEKEG